MHTETNHAAHWRTCICCNKIHSCPTLIQDIKNMYVHTHVHMYSTYVCSHVQYICMFSCTVNTYVHMYSTYVCSHVQYIRMFTCTVHTYVHMYSTYTCSHVQYIHMFICTVHTVLLRTINQLASLGRKSLGEQPHQSTTCLYWQLQPISLFQFRTWRLEVMRVVQNFPLRRTVWKKDYR